MRNTIASFLLVAVHHGGLAQTRMDLAAQSRNVDFSAAGTTRPIKTGTVLLATCQVGEMFFKTNAAAGRNPYGCGVANEWAQLSGAALSGCGLVGCENGECSIDSGIVPSYTGSLGAGQVLVGGGASSIRAVGSRSAGQILTSPGPGADPFWSDPLALTIHSSLSGLDYVSSGHTGFQPALEYVPEHELTFEAPLKRGSAHGIGPHAVVQVYDTSVPRKRVEPDMVTIDSSTGDVRVTFAAAQSGQLVIH